MDSGAGGRKREGRVRPKQSKNRGHLIHGFSDDPDGRRGCTKPWKREERREEGEDGFTSDSSEVSGEYLR